MCCNIIAYFLFLDPFLTAAYGGMLELNAAEWSIIARILSGLTLFTVFNKYPKVLGSEFILRLTSTYQKMAEIQLLAREIGQKTATQAQTTRQTAKSSVSETLSLLKDDVRF